MPVAVWIIAMFVNYKLLVSFVIFSQFNICVVEEWKEYLEIFEIDQEGDLDSIKGSLDLWFECMQIPTLLSFSLCACAFPGKAWVWCVRG